MHIYTFTWKDAQARSLTHYSIVSVSPCSSHTWEISPDLPFPGKVTSKYPNLLKTWHNFNGSSFLAKMDSAMAVPLSQ